MNPIFPVQIKVLFWHCKLYFHFFLPHGILRFGMSDCGHKGQYMFYNILNNYMKYSSDRQCIHIFLDFTLKKEMYTPLFTRYFVYLTS